MSGSNVKRAPGEAPLREVGPVKGGCLHPAISKGKLALIGALPEDKRPKLIKAVSWSKKSALDQEEVELIAIMDPSVEAGTEVAFSISKAGEDGAVADLTGKVKKSRATAKWKCEAPEPEPEKEEEQEEEKDEEEGDGEDEGRQELAVIEMPAYVFVAKCEEEEARSKCLLTVPLPPSPKGVGDAIPPPPEESDSEIPSPPSGAEDLIPPPPDAGADTIPPPPPPQAGEGTIPPPPATLAAAVVPLPPVSPPSYVVAVAVKEKGRGFLRGARYEVVRSHDSRVVATGITGGSGHVWKRVRRSGTGKYIVRILSPPGITVIPEPTSEKPLASKEVQGIWSDDRNAETPEIVVSLGKQPKFVYKNEIPENSDVKDRYVYIVERGSGKIHRAKIDEKGRAQLRLASKVKFDVYCSKRSIPDTDVRTDLEHLDENLKSKQRRWNLAHFDGWVKGVKPRDKIELTRLHRDRIERALFPKVRDILPLWLDDSLPSFGAEWPKEAYTDGRVSIDCAVCNTCSAFSKIILEGLGYKDVKTNGAAGHCTVRVVTPDDEEYIIDVSMTQFLKNSADIDGVLKDHGGFMGTTEELKAFCRDHLLDNNFAHGPVEPLALAEARELLLIRRVAKAYLEQAEAKGREDKKTKRARLLLADVEKRIPKDNRFWFVDLLGGDDEVYGQGLVRAMWETTEEEVKTRELYTLPRTEYKLQNLPVHEVEDKVRRLDKTVDQRLEEVRETWLKLRWGGFGFEDSDKLVWRELSDKEWGQHSDKGLSFLSLFRRCHDDSLVRTRAEVDVKKYRAWEAAKKSPIPAYEALQKAIESEK
ncbi:hypothetical protein ACFL59_01045 [Planctomycetota bacterium]